MKPRDYQAEAARCVLEEWKDNTSTVVVMPTGSGKTVLFAEIIRRSLPLKTMVIAHREELIWQARDKIQRICGVDAGVEMGDLRAAAPQTDLFGNDTSSVVIATVQTLNSRAGDRKRMSKFNPNDFAQLIIDECHHATADTYQNVTHYFKQNPKLKILGVTATPDRADEEALGQVFDSVAFDYEISDAIHDGWLVKPNQTMITINGLDYSAVRTTAGDLNGADLAQVMEAESNLHGVAGAMIQIMGDRRTLVFTVSVAQAEVLSEIFNRYKQGCSTWVCGETNKDKRREIVKDFAAGKYQVVVNCDCFTEGFDDPGVQVIGMAKPTKSRSKYAQMIGRAMRPLPGTIDHIEPSELRRRAIAESGKPFCEIVDFVGNSGKHKLVTCVDILGGKYPDDVMERAKITIAKKGTCVSVADILDEEEEKKRKEEEEQRKREAARKARLMAKVSFSAKTVSPFDLFDISPVAERRWDSGKVLSEKQKLLLLKQGVDPTSMSYAQSKQVINEMFRRWAGKLATLNQCKVLKRYGYETKNMTMQDASRLLDRLKNNGWKKVELENGKTQSLRTAEVRGGRSQLPVRAETGRPVGQGTAPSVGMAGAPGTGGYDDEEADGNVPF